MQAEILGCLHKFLGAPMVNELTPRCCYGIIDLSLKSSTLKSRKTMKKVITSFLPGKKCKET